MPHNPRKMLVFGGKSDMLVFNDLWSFDSRSMSWEELAPEPTSGIVEDVTFDGKFAGKVSLSPSSNIDVGVGDRPVLYFNELDGGNTTVIVYEVGASGSFSFMTNLPAATWRNGEIRLYPQPRHGHAASTITLQSSEVAMVIHGGIGLQGHSRHDTWILKINQDSSSMAWEQLTSISKGNYLSVLPLYGNAMRIKQNAPSRYLSRMVSVVASVDSTGARQEAFLVFAGADSIGISNGSNWDLITTSQFSPSLYYLCPDVNV